MQRARERLSWLSDVPFTDRVAVGLGLVLLPLLAFPDDEATEGITPQDFDAGAALILAGAVVVLLARKRFPGTTVLVVIALTCTWYLSGYTNGAINVPTLVAFYHLGTTGDRRRQFGIGAVALAAPVIAVLVLTEARPSQALDAVGYPFAAILFGEIVRNRRLLLTEYAARAAAAERDAESEAERRVTEERLRIARDVHDVLAHAVSVMTVQAAAGADALDRDPATARKALAAIRSAGKGAMAELRTTVAVLRNSGSGAGAGAGAGQGEAAPVPTLDRLPELVAGARAEGLDVDLGVDARPGCEGLDGIESLVQLAAYRVVQESLTNVIRHARAARATVRLAHQPSQLVVTVTDDGWGATGPAGPAGAGVAGAGAGRPPAGFGLRGMRERVESLGGTLRFGRRPDGGCGWEVQAALPVRALAWADR